MLRFLLIGALLHFSICLWGQYHAVVRYKQDYFPYTEFRYIFIDSKGFVWLTSLLGLTRFDGKKPLFFSVKTGLPQNEIIGIAEDKQGKMWIQHDPFFISVMDKSGQLDTVLEFQDSVIQYGVNFVDKSAMGGWLKRRENELWKFNHSNRTLEFRRKVTLGNEEGLTYITELYSGNYSEFKLFTLKVVPQAKHVLVYESADGETKKIPPCEFCNNAALLFIGDAPDGSLIFFKHKEKRFFKFAFESGWEPISIRMDIHQFTGKQSCLSERGTVFFYKPSRFEGEIVEFNSCFPRGIRFRFYMPEPPVNKPLHAVVKGKDGSFWVATRDGLLRVFPAFSDYLPTRDTNMVSDIHAICEDKSGRIWFASYQDGLAFFDGESIKPSPAELRGFRGFLPGSFSDEEGNMYLADDTHTGILIFDGEGKHRHELKGRKGYCFHSSFDNYLAWGMNKGAGIAIKSLEGNCVGDTCWKIIGEEKGLQLVNVLTATKDRYGRWWMGRESKGLAYYDSEQDTVFNFLRKNHLRDYGAMSSLMDNRGNLWFGTSYGLRFWESREAIDPAVFDPVLEFQRVAVGTLGESVITSLLQLDENTLVVGNLYGFGLLDLERFYAGDTVVHYFTADNGYTGNFVEQNCMIKDRLGRIWLGSNEGAHCFDPRFFIWDKSPPEFTIDSIVAGRMTYPANTSMLRLKPQINELTIFLSSAFDALLQDNVFFQYKFASDSLFSRPEKKSVLSFSHLGPGDYTLIIKAVRDGLQSEEKVLSFVIPKPFYKRFSFVLSVFFIAMMGMWAYVKSYQKTQDKISKLQLHAVLNTLNPHFINNVFQWMQIRFHQDEEAVKMISRIAENIRIILRRTGEKKAYHSLSKELKLVGNYLLIQKIRFGESFTYSLPTKEQIELLGDIDVPLMQIQVHCENAIEHGIRNKEGKSKGMLKVEVSDEGDYLHIAIEDNGIGRLRAKEIRSRGTQTGLKMLENLMNVLNKKNTNPIYYFYEDLIFKDPDRVAYGTRVNIYIPKNYNYEFK